MIKGNLINLRTVRDKEISEMFELLSDISERGKYWNLSLISEVYYKKKYEETGFWNDDFGTMIFTDKSDSIVGEIGYFKNPRNQSGYEIDYRVYKEKDRCQGYTTEALKLFSEYLFKLKPINRLEIQLINGNLASKRVAEKCKYSFEGTKRQSVYSRGKYHDVMLYSILREDVL